jgi:hypothetical protein
VNARIDLLPGGLADRRSPSEFDPRELSAGIAVEMEHTGDAGIALEIAMDHLAEFPDYYTRLAQMERAGKESLMAYYSPSGGPIHEGAAGLGSIAASFKMPARYSPAMAKLAFAAGCSPDCQDEYEQGILTAKGRAACCAKRFPEGPLWADFESCVVGARKRSKDALECLRWYVQAGYLTPKGYQLIVGTRRTTMRGIGEFFDAGEGGAPPPVVMAFQDGVFSGGRGDIWTSEETTDLSPVDAYQDGSLGVYEQASAGIGMPLYVDGNAVDAPMTIYHGPAGVGQTLSDLRRIDRPWLMPRGGVDRRRSVLRGLGQATQKVLDLSDPATIKETKTALAFAMPDLALTGDGQAIYTEAWYASPVWDGAASELMASFVKKVMDKTPSYKETDLAVTTDKGSYPTAVGVIAILSFGVGSPGYGTDPAYFPKNFPILHAFQLAVGADATSAEVKPPFFTEGEKVKGKEGMKVSTMAFIGLGAVAAIGAYFVLRKK